MHRCIFTITILFLSTLGCRETDYYYDVSNIDPFSSYNGQDVTLARDAIVIEGPVWWKDEHLAGRWTADRLAQAIKEMKTPDPFPDAYIVYRGDPAIALLRSEADFWMKDRKLRLISLPSGTTIHVEFTYLHKCTMAMGGPTNYRLYSVLTLHGIDGFPEPISAVFDHAPPEAPDKQVGFLGNIRRAPWEPDKVPATRTMPEPWYQDDREFARHRF